MCPELIHLVTLNSTHPIAWESELKGLWALSKHPFVALGFFNLGEKGEPNAATVPAAEGQGAQERGWPAAERAGDLVPCGGAALAVTEAGGLVQHCRDLPLS